MYITIPKGTVWLCQRCAGPADQSWRLSPIGIEGICTRCGAPTPLLFDGRCQDLHFVSVGPMFTSTSSEIVRHPYCVWDVNRYYADLGVRVDATRQEMVAAYHACDGQNSERLTYIVKWLANHDRRSYYDSLIPPQILFDIFFKRSIEAEIQERISEASDRSEQERLQKLDLGKLIGRAIHVRKSSPGLDSGGDPNQDAGTPQVGYFLWQSNRLDGSALARWREHLADHLRQGGVRRFAVGWHGASSQPALVVRPPAYPVDVFLLHQEREPSEDLAIEVVESSRAQVRVA